LELDLYGGDPHTYEKVGLDAGLPYYWYPSARHNITPGERYNTPEAQARARYRQFSAQYSYALTKPLGMNTSTIGGYCGLNSDGTPATSDCLGTGSSKGSGYVDLNAAFDAPVGLSLALHYGYQYVRNYAPMSYSDYKVGLSRGFGGVTLG